MQQVAERGRTHPCDGMALLDAQCIALRHQPLRGGVEADHAATRVQHQHAQWGGLHRGLQGLHLPLQRAEAAQDRVGIAPVRRDLADQREVGPAIGAAAGTGERGHHHALGMGLGAQGQRLLDAADAQVLVVVAGAAQFGAGEHGIAVHHDAGAHQVRRALHPRVLGGELALVDGHVARIGAHQQVQPPMGIAGIVCHHRPDMAAGGGTERGAEIRQPRRIKDSRVQRLQYGFQCRRAIHDTPWLSSPGWEYPET